jgi:hypothetical protein
MEFFKEKQSLEQKIIDVKKELSLYMESKEEYNLNNRLLVNKNSEIENKYN